MLRKIWKKAEVFVFVAILLLIALIAVAVWIPNNAGRRINLQIQSSVLVTEGLFAAQTEYRQKHGRFAAAFSELHFPDDINDRLGKFGRGFRITKSAVGRMQDGEYLNGFKYQLWTDKTAQELTVLALPDKEIRGYFIWLYADPHRGEAILMGNRRLDTGVLPGIASDPQVLRAWQTHADTYIIKTLPLPKVLAGSASQ